MKATTHTTILFENKIPVWIPFNKKNALLHCLYDKYFLTGFPSNQTKYATLFRTFLVDALIFHTFRYTNIRILTQKHHRVFEISFPCSEFFFCMF